MAARYQDRFDAGRQLAAHLQAYANRSDVLILALPRGGVPVAFVVASALHAPLDVFPVRKLGVPGQEELALGAIAAGKIQVFNQDVVRTLHLSEQTIAQIVQKEEQELARRERLYRDERPPLDLHDRIVILIDDGLATGASMRAAARAARKQNLAHLVIAVPVAAPSACEELRPEADEIICMDTPEPFYGVGWWYRDFEQTSDQEVHDLLARAGKNQPLAGKNSR